MPNRLETLKQPLDFRFIFEAKQGIEVSAFAGDLRMREKFAPKLLVWDPVDQRVLRATAQVTSRLFPESMSPG